MTGKVREIENRRHQAANQLREYSQNGLQSINLPNEGVHMLEEVKAFYTVLSDTVYTKQIPLTPLADLKST